jgi:RNA polymerase sigma factor (sigma-70 family)
MLGVKRRMTDLELDARLVATALSGDRGAFEELVARHARIAGRLATRLVRNREDAEDVVQESFVKAYTHLADFRLDAPFRAWLLRIVMSVAHDHLRSRARRSWSLAGQPIEGLAIDQDSSDKPISRDRIDAMRGAIDELPSKQRAALLLKVYEGLSHQEVARVIGSTAGATRVYLALARQSLRRRFAKWFTGEEGSAP